MRRCLCGWTQGPPFGFVPRGSRALAAILDVVALPISLMLFAPADASADPEHDSVAAAKHATEHDSDAAPEHDGEYDQHVDAEHHSGADEFAVHLEDDASGRHDRADGRRAGQDGAGPGRGSALPGPAPHRIRHRAAPVGPRSASTARSSLTFSARVCAVMEGWQYRAMGRLGRGGVRRPRRLGFVDSGPGVAIDVEDDERAVPEHGLHVGAAPSLGGRLDEWAALVRVGDDPRGRR